MIPSSATPYTCTQFTVPAVLQQACLFERFDLTSVITTCRISFLSTLSVVLCLCINYNRYLIKQTCRFSSSEFDDRSFKASNSVRTSRFTVQVREPERVAPGRPGNRIWAWECRSSDLRAEKTRRLAGHQIRNPRNPKLACTELHERGFYRG